MPTMRCTINLPDFGVKGRESGLAQRLRDLPIDPTQAEHHMRQDADSKVSALNALRSACIRCVLEDAHADRIFFIVPATLSGEPRTDRKANSDAALAWRISRAEAETRHADPHMRGSLIGLGLCTLPNA
jgi:hypothetical protein